MVGIETLLGDLLDDANTPSIGLKNQDFQSISNHIKVMLLYSYNQI
jgi:hypothetical protein